jgi:transposase-like protein
VINFDKNPAYIGAVQDLKQDGQLPAECERRLTQYLNNIVEQDHRCVKREFRATMGYGTYPTAWFTICGIEADHMIRKGQIEGVGKSDIISQKQFVHGLFGLAQ